MNSAVVLVGHGSVATDVPRPLIQRLRALEQQRRASGTAMSNEEIELDQKVRSWPRNPATDPYKAGIDAIAERLRARVGRVVVAFNEFCAPSLEDAVHELVSNGVLQVTVVTTMLTPGGMHSEIEIPESVRALQHAYPEIRISYAWPFDLDAVAGLLAAACADSTRH
jgi:sirohydrochlorin cobaltochelatase